MLTLYNPCFLRIVHADILADLAGRLPHDRKVQGSNPVAIDIVLNASGVIAVYPCGSASRFVERACTPLVPCYVLHSVSSTVAFATDSSGQRFVTVVFATDSSGQRSAIVVLATDLSG